MTTRIECTQSGLSYALQLPPFCRRGVLRKKGHDICTPGKGEDGIDELGLYIDEDMREH
jgi:hypothetical protein